VHAYSEISLGALSSGGVAYGMEVVVALQAVPNENNRSVSNPNMRSVVFEF